jgi:hypothetical protein
MIFWISDNNALTGPIPSELGLLEQLTYLALGKSFSPFYFVQLCYKLTLFCLDNLSVFSEQHLDWSGTFGTGIAQTVDCSSPL